MSSNLRYVDVELEGLKVYAKFHQYKTSTLQRENLFEVFFEKIKQMVFTLLWPNTWVSVD